MIKINCKEGVWFKFISYEFLVLAQIIYAEYEKEGIVPTVTSAADGSHMDGSYHYDGLGWDWRTWGIKDVTAVAKRVREKARDVDFRYDVVVESDHIHTEYDIRKVA